MILYIAGEIDESRRRDAESETMENDLMLSEETGRRNGLEASGTSRLASRVTLRNTAEPAADLSTDR